MAEATRDEILRQAAMVGRFEAELAAAKAKLDEMWPPGERATTPIRSAANSGRIPLRAVDSLPAKLVAAMMSEPGKVFTPTEVAERIGADPKNMNDVRSALSRLANRAGSGVKKIGRGKYTHSQEKTA